MDRRSAVVVLMTLVLGCAGHIDSSTGAAAKDARGPDAAPSQSALWNRILTGSPTCCQTLPFAHEFGSDGRLYAIVGNERFPATFGTWAGHAWGHTGHIEGDNKANYRILIHPRGRLFEAIDDQVFNRDGNDDGVCDPGEGCGVTEATAHEFAPWYTATAGMYLGRIRNDGGVHDGLGYMPGEEQWRLELYVIGARLTLQHLGELSPELEELLRANGHADLVNLPGGMQVELAEPLPVPEGMRIARPQLAGNPNPEVGGEAIYVANTQTEWSWERLDVERGVIPCQYQLFRAEEQQALQRALDLDYESPSLMSPFRRFGNSSLALETLAESAICSGVGVSFNNYAQLNSDNGYGWLDRLNARPTGEVFSFFPIHKETGTYAAHAAEFYSPKTSFMIIRGFQEPGIYTTDASAIELHDANGATYRVRELSAQALDFLRESDTPANTSLVARIERTQVRGTDDPLGMFFGVRYALRADRVIVVWGDLAPTREAVVIPPEIPAGDVTCNAQPYSCFTHDLSIGVSP